jgi:putative ATP-binding cassette transporter
MAPLHRHAWLRVFAVGKGFFLSPLRWRAAGALTAILALLLTLNALNVANSYVGRNFMTAIAQRDGAQYFRFAVLYIGVFAASTVTGVSQQFVQDRLALSWRDWLTRHLIDRYLSAHTFARIRARTDIDNPDQRIAEDVRTFTGTLMSFVVMIANSTLTTVAFAGVLWSITPLLLVTAVLYAALGSVVTVLLGHRRVVHNSRAIIGVTRNVGFFTSGYNYLVQILPILIVAPRYLRGTIEFGVVTQSAMAFAQLLGAFSLILVQFQSISAFAAVARRLGSLLEAMDAVGPEAIHGMLVSGART